MEEPISYLTPEQQRRLDELHKQLTRREAAYARCSHSPMLLVEEIRYRRIIMHMRGRILCYDPAKQWGIRFVTDNRQEMFYPDHLNIAVDGTFELSLNIMCSHDEQPLKSGSYYPVLFEKYPDHRLELSHEPTPESTIERYGTKVFHVTYDAEGYQLAKIFLTMEYPAVISPSLHQLCDNTASNPWNFKVNKTKSSWLHVIARENVDTGLFYLAVSYKPFANYGVLFLNRKQKKSKRQANFRKFRSNVGHNIADTKLWTIRFLNHIFQKMARREGNIILFCSASRAEIGGNEKFIYDRMIERGLDKQFQFRFDFKPSITTNRSFFKMIKFDYYLATSDVVVIDDYYPLIYDVSFDPRVKLVQVWHACGAFKTVGFERIGKSDAPHFNSLTHKNYTHVIVSSEISAKHNAEAFCIAENKFYITGIPRTDLFFDKVYQEQTRKRMLEAFPGCQGRKKVYLYAPTFRGTNANNADFPFGMVDLEQWGRLLKKENSALIIKMHPFVRRHMAIPQEYADRIFDAGEYREVNDILFISDVLITDYSSVIYEMSLLNKPMIFYAFDQYSYENSRDFYEPYEDTVPGKIVHYFDELLVSLERDDYDFHKMDAFVHKNFAHLDGKSTDRVIDQIFLQ